MSDQAAGAAADLGTRAVSNALFILGARVVSRLISLVVVVVLAIRTILEDATLQRELPGYAEFAAITRYRWIPGIW